jgi:hypothetical protein
MNRKRHENGTTVRNDISVWTVSARRGTHNECLQVHPIVTEQEPYVTNNSKTACGTAGSNRGVSMRGDLEDGVWGNSEHRCVRPKCRC